MTVGMRDFYIVTGIVLKAEPIGEYDRRIVLLTKERGKITAFAKFSRKPGNKLMAPTNPFCFGQFKIYEGRSAYTIAEAEIANYFEELRKDFEGAYYGIYFMEICDYYGRENNDDSSMLKLLYQSLRALSAKSIPRQLVRCIFECKAIMVNGEFQHIRGEEKLHQTTIYTITYIWNTPVEKLYTFTLKEDILKELQQYCKELCRCTWDRDFKSLEILENLT